MALVMLWYAAVRLDARLVEMAMLSAASFNVGVVESGIGARRWYDSGLLSLEPLIDTSIARDPSMSRSAGLNIGLREHFARRLVD